MHVLAADPDRLAEVASVLDAAALETDIDELRRAIDRDEVLVAVTAPSRDDTPPTVLGAVVLDGREIAAIAVRPGRRGQGIGSALVEAAREETDRLVAEFDPEVRPFWNALGFESSPIPDSDRLRGVRR